MDRLGTGTGGNASQLNIHINDHSNPHVTTASQVGADIVGSASAVQENLNLHTEDLSNPHFTTASQVGADAVGSSGSVQSNLNIHTEDLSNPHSTTASQINAVVANNPISGGVYTKIGYDAKGLIISGSNATTYDIEDSLNRRYVTESEKTVIANTSGSNSGDQIVPQNSFYTSGCVLVAYNGATGSFTSASILSSSSQIVPISFTNTSGSYLVGYNSSTGSFVSANVSLDRNGFWSKSLGELYLTSGSISIVNDSSHNAFPGVCSLSNGSVVVVYRVATNHGTSKGTIYKKSSPDGGSSWSSASSVYADPTYDVRDPSITRLRNGELIVSTFVYNQSGSDLLNACRIVSSTNSGSTWNLKSSIVDGFTSWSHCSSPVVEMPDGTLVLGMFGLDSGDTYQHIRIAISKDGGATWSTGLIAKSASRHYQEPNLISTKDGILCISRSDTPSMAAGNLYSNRSYDGGYSWSSPVLLWEGTGSPRITSLSNGAMIVVYRKNSDDSYDLAYRFSEDGGYNWGDEQTISSNYMVYASSTEYEAGLIGMVYGDEISGGTNSDIWWRKFSTIINSGYFVSKVSSEIAPMIVSSSMVVTNLNASYLSGCAVQNFSGSLHHIQHENGGSDVIKLDDLGAPDNNADLDSSTTRHGLLPILSGDSNYYLNGLGNWTIPPSSGSSGSAAPLQVEPTSGCFLSGYNSTTGSFTSASVVSSSGSQVVPSTVEYSSGCALVAYNSSTGSFTTGAVGSSGSSEYPNWAFVPASIGEYSTTGSSAFNRMVFNTSQILGFQTFHQGDGDSLIFDVPLASGSYLFSVVGTKFATRGKIDWYIDGVQFISGQDWYNASSQNNHQYTASVVCSYSGVHEIKYIQNGHHASATGSGVSITLFQINP